MHFPEHPKRLQNWPFGQFIKSQGSFGFDAEIDQLFVVKIIFFMKMKFKLRKNT